MTPGRWAKLLAYFLLAFGSALFGCTIYHNWSVFPGYAGVDLIMGGLLIYLWIRPEKDKDAK